MTDSCLNHDNFRLGNHFLEVFYLDYHDQNENEYDYIESNLRKLLKEYDYIESNYSKSYNRSVYRISFKSCIQKFEILIKYSNIYKNKSIMFFNEYLIYNDDLLNKNNYYTKRCGYNIYMFNNSDINLTLLKITYPDCIVIS